MTSAKITVNDFITLNDTYAGVIKSRKGKYVNAPSAGEGQTTVFYEMDWANQCYGTAHEIDAPAMILDRVNMTSIINPAVVAEIEKIIK